MAGFINFEADVEGTYVDEVSNISDSDSLKSFIDNEEVQTDVSFYQHFTNVEVDIEQRLKEAYDKAVNDIEKYDEISNLCESSEEEFEIGNFKKSKDNTNTISLSCHEQVCLSGLRFERYFSHHRET